MGQKISKYYYSFHPVSAKLYEDIGYHGGTQAITFIAMGQVLTFCGTLKF